jgi:hypothetical protein
LKENGSRFYQLVDHGLDRQAAGIKMPVSLGGQAGESAEG